MHDVIQGIPGMDLLPTLVLTLYLPDHVDRS
jgi:hypothetical protein